MFATFTRGGLIRLQKEARILHRSVCFGFPSAIARRSVWLEHTHTHIIFRRSKLALTRNIVLGRFLDAATNFYNLGISLCLALSYPSLWFFLPGDGIPRGAVRASRGGCGRRGHGIGGRPRNHSRGAPGESGVNQTEAVAAAASPLRPWLRHFCHPALQTKRQTPLDFVL